MLRRKIHSLIIFILGIMLLCFTIAACGKKESPKNLDMSGYDWQSNGFTVSGSEPNDDFLFVRDVDEITPLHNQDAKWETVSFGAVGSKIWILYAELDESGNLTDGANGCYEFRVIDIFSNSDEIKSFYPKDFGVSDEWGFFAGADLTESGECCLRWTGFSRDEDDMFFKSSDTFFLTDFKGNTKKYDLLDALSSTSMEIIIHNELESWPYSEFRYTGSEFVFSHNDQVVVYGLDGKILAEYRCNTAETAKIFTDEKANILMAVYSRVNQQSSFWKINTSAGVFDRIESTADVSDNIGEVLGIYNNEVYYLSRDIDCILLIRWNIATGERTRVLNLKSAGIGTNYNLTVLGDYIDSIYLFLDSYNATEQCSRVWVCKADNNVNTDGQIVVADYTGKSILASQCAFEASARIPGKSYTYRDITEQSLRDKTEIELSQGRGPDILVLSREEMCHLADKGLLDSIDVYIDTEHKSDIINGAIGIGTYNDTWYGIPTGVIAETFAIRKDCPAIEKWNIESVLEMMGNGKLAGRVYSPMLTQDYLPADFTISIMLLSNLNDSFLIDWSEKKARFDDSRFISFLELQRGKEKRLKTDEKWFEDSGDIVWLYLVNVSQYEEAFRHIESENAVITGFPSNKRNVGYLSDVGGIVAVNKNSPNKEAIKEYLNLLISPETQINEEDFRLSILKINPDDYCESGEDGILYRKRTGQSIRITEFPDGTNTIDKAKDFFESCMPAPDTYREIDKIVFEELASAVDSDTMAKVINRRIQLYLDERY